METSSSSTKPDTRLTSMEPEKGAAAATNASIANDANLKAQNKKAYKKYVEVENTNRQAFSGIESLLSSLGQAVGLGNIWRFPTMAYKNGGSSFLIPYFVCAVLFAIPAIHMEYVLGQYAAKSPPAVFRRIMPALEGIGWMTCIVGGIIGIYYMILIAWIAIYLLNVTNAVSLSKCNNWWNKNTSTICYEGIQQKKCRGFGQLGTNFVQNSTQTAHRYAYINGRCQDVGNSSLSVGAEQFFAHYVIKPSTGFTDFNSINTPMLGSVAVCWVIACVVLIRGMKSIGKTAYFTVLLPYAIIIILMIRGITLEGSSTGLYFLWAKVDFSAIYSLRTWIAAMTQICFSLSIGQGGLMNIASYNKKTYNWYRDAYLLVLCDTLMSLIGGTAVFATLGFLAKQRDVDVPEVIQEGHALAFIVYAEAIAQMPLPTLWYLLFFLMLFLLGISTEIVIIEIVCSCITDRFRYLRRHRWLTVISVCVIFFGLGLIMTTDAGYYWFELYDEYSAGVSATVGTAVMCIVVCWVYGVHNFREDIAEMRGRPQTLLAEYLGPASYFWVVVWRFITPLCALVTMAFWVWDRQYPFKGDAKKYPPLFDIIGWFVATLPFFAIPWFAVASVIKFKRRKIPLRGVLMLQKQHPAFERIQERWPEWKRVIGDQLPEQEPGDTDIENIDMMNDCEEESFMDY